MPVGQPARCDIAGGGRDRPRSGRSGGSGARRSDPLSGHGPHASARTSPARASEPERVTTLLFLASRATMWSARAGEAANTFGSPRGGLRWTAAALTPSPTLLRAGTISSDHAVGSSGRGREHIRLVNSGEGGGLLRPLHHLRSARGAAKGGVCHGLSTNFGRREARPTRVGGSATASPTPSVGARAPASMGAATTAVPAPWVGERRPERGQRHVRP